ncbi:hypothetical protein AVEN_78502-1 [Araneus ventricosus]|uniref:Uncharacterized protein n=1 Tax=Araneus ventricosus TaxID=182803 RepID=A0A4Y2EP36_ARAVE|nr:hypothetical protein AVEN_78502-1 [Araneus ventricosus]
MTAKPQCHTLYPGRGGLVVRSRPRSWRVPGSKPDSTEEPSCKRVWCTLNLSELNNHPLVWCPQPTTTDSPIVCRVHRDGRGTGVVWKFGEGV